MDDTNEDKVLSWGGIIRTATGHGPFDELKALVLPRLEALEAEVAALKAFMWDRSGAPQDHPPDPVARGPGGRFTPRGG